MSRPIMNRLSSIQSKVGAVLVSAGGEVPLDHLLSLYKNKFKADLPYDQKAESLEVYLLKNFSNICRVKKASDGHFIVRVLSLSSLKDLLPQDYDEPEFEPISTVTETKPQSMKVMPTSAPKTMKTRPLQSTANVTSTTPHHNRHNNFNKLKPKQAFNVPYKDDPDKVARVQALEKELQVECEKRGIAIPTFKFNTIGTERREVFCVASWGEIKVRSHPDTFGTEDGAKASVITKALKSLDGISEKVPRISCTETPISEIPPSAATKPSPIPQAVRVTAQTAPARVSLQDDRKVSSMVRKVVKETTLTPNHLNHSGTERIHSGSLSLNMNSDQAHSESSTHGRNRSVDKESHHLYSTSEATEQNAYDENVHAGIPDQKTIADATILENLYQNEKTETYDQSTYTEGYDQSAYAEGQNQSAYAEGYDQTAYAEGYDQTAYAEGYDQTAYAEGYDQTAYAGGYDQTASAEGYDQTASAEGYDQTAYAEGYDQTVYAEGYDQTAYAEGYDQTEYVEQTAYAEGYDQTACAEGYDQTAYAEGYDQTAYAEGYDQTEYAEGYDQTEYVEQTAYAEGHDQTAYTEGHDQTAYTEGYDQSAYPEGYDQNFHLERYDQTAYTESHIQTANTELHNRGTDSKVDAYAENYDQCSYTQNHDQSADTYDQNAHAESYDENSYAETYDKNAKSETYDQEAYAATLDQNFSSETLDENVHGDYHDQHTHVDSFDRIATDQNSYEEKYSKSSQQFGVVPNGKEQSYESSVGLDCEGSAHTDGCVPEVVDLEAVPLDLSPHLQDDPTGELSRGFVSRVMDDGSLAIQIRGPGLDAWANQQFVYDPRKPAASIFPDRWYLIEIQHEGRKHGERAFPYPDDAGNILYNEEHKPLFWFCDNSYMDYVDPQAVFDVLNQEEVASLPAQSLLVHAIGVTGTSFPSTFQDFCPPDHECCFLPAEKSSCMVENCTSEGQHVYVYDTVTKTVVTTKHETC